MRRTLLVFILAALGVAEPCSATARSNADAVLSPSVARIDTTPAPPADKALLVPSRAGGGGSINGAHDGSGAGEAAESLGRRGHIERVRALDCAALRALEEPLQDRGRRELAGVIYRTAEGYGFTAPQRSRVEGGFELRLRPGVDLPRGAEVAAIYHTHPRAAGRMSDAHSPHDVAVAQELGRTSYIGVVATGAVRRYTPKEEPRAPASYPRGAHVGARVEGCARNE